MDIRPILASLRKHRIPTTLIVLEIALACAVLCNAVFMISQRVAELHMPNAIDERGLVDISVTGNDPQRVNDDIPRNLAALRRIPGVIAAAVVTSVPFGKGFGIDSVSAQADGKDAPGSARYMFTQGGPEALGLQLLAGRFFSADEYAASKLAGSFMPNGDVVLVTTNLAQRLWPGQDALGRQLWMGGTHHYTVVGIVADVARPGPASDSSGTSYRSTFFPLSPDPALSDYLVRAAPQHLDQVLGAATTTLETLSASAVIKGQTFTEIRDASFADTSSMAWMLVLVCVVMLAVTAFGIVGLTSFWVGQRRRQIGIRRAVGATRGQILQYFQTENFLIVSGGIVLGMALAYALNLLLMTHYELPRLPLYYLPIGALVLWGLGQLAVLGPALRAAAVPPVVATRSV